jgi:hypothetical protein
MHTIHIIVRSPKLNLTTFCIKHRICRRRAAIPGLPYTSRVYHEFAIYSGGILDVRVAKTDASILGKCP